MSYYEEQIKFLEELGYKRKDEYDTWTNGERDIIVSFINSIVFINIFKE